jgi:hypothetical protein
MAKRYDNVPWTPIEAYPEGKPKPPCGFVLETYKVDGNITHFRFVPEGGDDWCGWFVYDSPEQEEEFP